MDAHHVLRQSSTRQPLTYDGKQLTASYKQRKQSSPGDCVFVCLFSILWPTALLASGGQPFNKSGVRAELRGGGLTFMSDEMTFKVLPQPPLLSFYERLLTLVWWRPGGAQRSPEEQSISNLHHKHPMLHLLPVSAPKCISTLSEEQPALVQLHSSITEIPSSITLSRGSSPCMMSAGLQRCR